MLLNAKQTLIHIAYNTHLLDGLQCNATRDDFEHVIASMKKAAVEPANYITHRATFEQVKDEFESWLGPATGVVKAMIEMT